MFDLEIAIQDWKRELRSTPAFEDGDIAELESHLREEIHRLRSRGLTEFEAFNKAVHMLGVSERIGNEMYKTRTVRIDANPPWKQNFWFQTLLPNYLKTAIRNMKKNPVYSSINILGLATGIACCILILIFLQFKLSFDDFHRNSEQLYRLNKVVTPKSGGTERHAITSGPMGPQIKQDFPQVKKVIRVLPWFDDGIVTYENTIHKVDQFVLVDSTFLQVFDFRLRKGEASTALDEPLSIVITESVENRLFKGENPIGKTVRALNDLEYTVTGVVEDPPENSHITYDVLVSWSSTGPSALGFGWLENWFPQALYTYLLLEETADPDELESGFPEFMERHFPQRADQYSLYLQPFSELYLHSTSLRFADRIKTGSINNIYVFSVSALLILLIACVNFINLTTAQSIDRAREVGVRKTLGAVRNQLGWQFLGESLAMSLVAMIIAIILVQGGKPVLEFVDVPTEVLHLSEHLNLLLVCIGIGICTGLIAGIYPAIVLSGFKPVNVLYGRTDRPFGRDKLLRKSLVILQFGLSIMLITGTLVINRQMQFISNKNLGFQKDQILVVPIDDTGIMKQAKVFEQELLKLTNIQQIAASNYVPGMAFMSFGVNPEGKPQDQSWTVNVLLLGDDDFKETYGLEMAAGRFFSEDFATDDSTALVINEALVKSLGWDEAVGKRIDIPGEIANGEVIGVVKDFHTSSLHKPIEPLIIFMDDRRNMLSLRVKPSDMDRTIRYIHNTWNRFEKAYPFEYFFLDDRFDTFYNAEKKLLKLAGSFTVIAILLACLGLFGLSTYMIRQRTKEVGIRKVLGASMGKIVKLLSFEFLILVGVGFIIAVPISYWLSMKWLKDFSFRIDLGIDLFLLSGLVALAFACIAVSYQSIRAALMNPVNSLRSE